MAKKNKDPLADWTGPQLDKANLDAVLDKYFSSHPTVSNPTTDESQKNLKSDPGNSQIYKDISQLTGSITGSTAPNLPPPIKPISVRLDATHTPSESLIYSVMYRETQTKNISCKRFSISQLMRLTGIRSKNTVRQALEGLQAKLSIRHLSPYQATRATLYEVRKVKEILEDREKAGIKILDRKIVKNDQPDLKNDHLDLKKRSPRSKPDQPTPVQIEIGSNPLVFHSPTTLTGSNFDPVRGSNFDPLLNGYINHVREEDIPAKPAVNISSSLIQSQNRSLIEIFSIFEQILNRGLTEKEQQRVLEETKEIIRSWAIAKSLSATQPIREVTYFLNGLRQALTPKQSDREIDSSKLRRWLIKMLKEKWPNQEARSSLKISEASEYLKQSLANHRINYNPHVSLISEVLDEWFRGIFDK